MAECGCKPNYYFAAVVAPNGAPYHYHPDGQLHAGGPDGENSGSARSQATAKAKPIAGWQPRGWKW